MQEHLQVLSYALEKLCQKGTIILPMRTEFGIEVSSAPIFGDWELRKGGQRLPSPDESTHGCALIFGSIAVICN